MANHVWHTVVVNDIPPAVTRALRRLFSDADDAIKLRDERLKKLVAEHGLRPADVRRITGRSDETIRRALMTDEQREGLRRRRRKSPSKPTIDQP